MDLDQDVLYWNAHAFFNSKLLLALKDVVALRAAAEAVQRHWDPFAEAIPIPFHEKWLEQCAEMAGLIIEQVLHEVCWEDVKPIIESNSDSKLMRLMTDKLDWALEVQSCWLHWKRLQGTSARLLETLEERESELRALQNDRPRLLLQKKMGSKKKTVEVEFYRADLTDLPFCFGDTCFYLVSKFADLPMADMLSSRTTALGALAQRFDGLRQHILAIEAGRLEDYVSVANVEATVHRVHVFNDLPNEEVPFGLAVVDLGSSNENLNVAELYKDLMCLDKVLLEKDCSSLLTVLTGYGPKTLRCFAELSVDLVLRELCGWVEYLAPHCRPLRKVQVCSFKSETATEIRNYFAGGRTVPENSIDQLQRRVANDRVFSEWLEGLNLRPAVDGFIEKARQTVADRKDYHCQLSSKMRELIGQFVENVLMASFGVRDAYIDSQRDRFRTGVHLMAGQVAHWMNLHRDLIAQRKDREILSKICQRIKGINDRYVNVGAHPEGLTEQKLDELDLAASETFEAIDEMLHQASSWCPSPTPVATLQQLRTPAAAPRPPRPPVSPASPASPASPVSPASPGATVTVHMRNGEQYTVDGGRSYVVGGVRKPICKFFCSGSCKQMKNCKQGAHPCKFQDSCRNAKCIFDHPEPHADPAETAEAPAPPDSEEEPAETEPRFAKEVCRFFTRSHCQRGDRCPFVHPCSAGKSCGKQSCRLDHPL